MKQILDDADYSYIIDGMSENDLTEFAEAVCELPGINVSGQSFDGYVETVARARGDSKLDTEILLSAAVRSQCPPPNGYEQE